MNAVARAWTLVYGVMLDVEWPDQLPTAFAQQHGVGRLRDQLTPEIPSEIKLDARRYLDDTVAEIRQQIFPLHGIV